MWHTHVRMLALRLGRGKKLYSRALSGRLRFYLNERVSVLPKVNCGLTY